MSSVQFTMRVKIESLNRLNTMHWRARKRYADPLKTQAYLETKAARPSGGPPWVVTMTRIAPRALDSGDNNRAGFKGIRDSIAKALGLDDGPDSPITWVYDQERGGVREYAARVEIKGMDKARA